MNIEITGCNNCPFKRYTPEINWAKYTCSLDGTIGTKNYPKEEFKIEIPEDCPIPKEGITIKPKQ